MDTTPLYTSIGFAEKEVAVGTHVCLIYSSEKERTGTLLKFILSGMQRNERTACFTDTISEDEVSAFFKENNISYSERKSESAISISPVSTIYFEGGEFDPERMLNTLINYYKESKTLGFANARVIGEMSPEIEHIPGGERLLEYESRVSMLLKENPITTVCQYNANLFDGATIMGVLKVHPQMIINGAIVQNPFYIEPEEFLKSN